MKQYIKPKAECLQAECSEIIAISIINNGVADSSEEVMIKEDNDWNIWEDSD